MKWEDQFRHRMRGFESGFLPEGHGTPLSIKVRVSSGCFHRQHSPNAYRIIDEHIRAQRPENVSFEEHESGPELLVYVALATAGISLAANVINLVVAIIKARAEGIEHGDGPHDPIELIVRGYDKTGSLREEKVLRFKPHDAVNKDAILTALQKGIVKICGRRVAAKRPQAKRGRRALGGPDAR